MHPRCIRGENDFHTVCRADKTPTLEVETRRSPRQPDDVAAPLAVELDCARSSCVYHIAAIVAGARAVEHGSEGVRTGERVLHKFVELVLSSEGIARVHVLKEAESCCTSMAIVGHVSPSRGPTPTFLRGGRGSRAIRILKRGPPIGAAQD